MSTWRRKAIEMLPELKGTISKAEGPGELWMELDFAFEDAFTAGNDDLVQRILKYARYCLAAQSGDVRTSAALGFIENLTIGPKIAAAIPTWFTLEEFDGLQELFKYHGGAELVAQLRSQYQNKK